MSCLGLLVFEVTGSQSDTWTPGRFPLKGMSNLCRSHYLHNTQQSQPKNIHTFSGIRTREPINRTVTDLRLRSHLRWDRRISRIRISYYRGDSGIRTPQNSNNLESERKIRAYFVPESESPARCSCMFVRTFPQRSATHTSDTKPSTSDTLAKGIKRQRMQTPEQPETQLHDVIMEGDSPSKQ